MLRVQLVEKIKPDIKKKSQTKINQEKMKETKEKKEKIYGKLG